VAAPWRLPFVYSGLSHRSERVYLLAFRQLALVMKHMLASTSKDNTKVNLGLLDEAYTDRVVPDAKYLSKR
jgi:hypothetical protein